MDIISSMTNVNWLAIVTAAISAFIIGGIWYGPLFGKIWMSEFSFTDEGLAKRNQTKIFAGTLLLNVLIALNMSLFLGAEVDLKTALIAGFLTGFGFVTPLIGVFYLFEEKSMKLFLVNAGFSIITFSLIGLIIGAMH